MNFKDNNIELDEKKLRRLQNYIYLLERDNLKRKPPMNDGEMVDKIRKIIEEEVKKCY